MRKFIINILAIGIVSFFLFYALDVYISRQLYKSNVRMFRNWNEVFFDSTYHDLVINGSSRAWIQYNPAIIDSILGTDCYNLGLDGHGISTQIARYYAYLSTHKKPKYIIQNVDLFTIQPSNKFEREQFLPYIHFDTIYNPIHKEEGYSWFDYKIPFIRYFGYKDVIFEGLGLHNDLVKSPNLYKGFQGKDAEWSSSIDNMNQISFTCDEKCSKLFESYLNRCKKDNVQVILVYAPMYRGLLDKESSAAELMMYNYYQNLANKYDCIILNYLWTDICTDKKYFYNVTHMNLEGSNKFTKYLANDIDSLGIISSKVLY